MGSLWNQVSGDSYISIGTDNLIYFYPTLANNWINISEQKNGYIWISHQDRNGDFLLVGKDNYLYSSPGLYIKNIDTFQTKTNISGILSFDITLDGYIAVNTNGQIIIYNNTKSSPKTVYLKKYPGKKIKAIRSLPNGFAILDDTYTAYISSSGNKNSEIQTASWKNISTNPDIGDLIDYSITYSNHPIQVQSNKRVFSGPSMLIGTNNISAVPIKSWYSFIDQKPSKTNLSYLLLDGSDKTSNTLFTKSLKDTNKTTKSAIYNLLDAFPKSSLFPYKFVTLYDLLTINKAKYIYTQQNASKYYDMFIMTFNAKTDSYLPTGDIIIPHTTDIRTVWIPLIYHDNSNKYSAIIRESDWVSATKSYGYYGNDIIHWSTAAVATKNRIYDTQFISVGDIFTEGDTYGNGTTCLGYTGRPFAAVHFNYVCPITTQPNSYKDSGFLITELSIRFSWSTGVFDQNSHVRDNYDVFTSTTSFNTFNITGQTFIRGQNDGYRFLPNPANPAELPTVSGGSGQGGKASPFFGGIPFYWPTYIFFDLMPAALYAILCGGRQGNAYSSLGNVNISLTPLQQANCKGYMQEYMTKNNYDNINQQSTIDWCRNTESWGGSGTCDLMLTAFCQLGPDGKKYTNPATMINYKTDTPDTLKKKFPNSTLPICGSFMPAPDYYAAMDYSKSSDPAIKDVVQALYGQQGYNTIHCTTIGSLSPIHESTYYPPTSATTCPNLQICVNAATIKNYGTMTNSPINVSQANNCSQSTTENGKTTTKENAVGSQSTVTAPSDSTVSQKGSGTKTITAPPDSTKPGTDTTVFTPPSPIQVVPPPESNYTWIYIGGGVVVLIIVIVIVIIMMKK